MLSLPCGNRWDVWPHNCITECSHRSLYSTSFLVLMKKFIVAFGRTSESETAPVGWLAEVCQLQTDKQSSDLNW